MRIHSFQVQGLANFANAVALGPLEEINLLYGPSNAGKSNLLRAVELYFRLMGAGEAVTKAQRDTLDQPDDELRELLSVSFSRTAPQPIVLDVEWTLAGEDLEEAGLLPDFPYKRVKTVLELDPAGRSLEIRVRKWLMEQTDVAPLDRDKDPALVGFAQQIRRLLSDARPFQFDQPVLPAVRLGQSAELFPQSLRDALFDARQSLAPEARKRWALFCELAATMRAELGAGSWETVFERSTGRADLVYVRGEESVRLEWMGAGVQRLTALVAELALAPERWIMMEEPEWRLSPSLQKRLATLARRVVRAGLGPRQFFITTHSPTLASLGTAFAVELAEGAPVAEQKGWELSPDSSAIQDGTDAPGSEGGEDLGHLIGLVDSLAELDPDDIVEGKQRSGGR
jgi:hypothetical protein